MDKKALLTMPEAMLSAIGELASERNCSTETIMKLAVAKFLFDHTLQEPEMSNGGQISGLGGEKSLGMPSELPLDRIVSVQYTLDDGRIIHVLRQSMLR